MSSRYDSRRFHRSPKVSTPSYQTLPINSNVTPRQLMSPTARNRSDSYDDGYQETYNENYEPLINSLLQRMNVLENSIKQEKSERLEDMTKLLKMIKEMECKHTSIIYDSEIKYNKPAFMPHLFDAFQNRKEDAKSIKKVSSYVFEKNLSQVRVDNNSSSHRNLRKSEVQGSKITQASQKQSRKSVFISQNPQKPKQTPKKAIPINPQPNYNSHPQHQHQHQQQAQSQNIPANQLSSMITQKVQSMRQQIVTKINHKIIEIRQEIKQTQSKLYSQIVSTSSNPNKCYQHMFSMHKQHVADVVSGLTKDLEEIRSGNLGGCGGDVGVQMERIQYKMQQMFQIFNDFSNPLKQRVQAMQNQQKHQKNSLDYLYHTITALPQTMNTKIQALGQHQEQNKQNIEQKIQQLLRSAGKIERIENEQREQVQQLNNIKLLTQNDYSNLIKRLNQIENYFTLKLEANQRYIVNIQDNSQKLMQEIQQDRVKKAHQVSQAERKRQQIYREVQARLQNKFDVLKISTLKQMHSINSRTQGNLVQIIEKHIGFIQEYLKNIQQKHNFLALKYFSPEQNQEKQSSQIYRNPFSKLTSLPKSGHQQYNLCQDVPSLNADKFTG